MGRTRTLRISYMKHLVTKKIYLILFLLLNGIDILAQTREITISKRYLNLPVSSKSENRQMILESPTHGRRTFYLRLADSNPEYYVFYDVAEFKGETIKLDYPSETGLNLVYQDDEIDDAKNLYKEKDRAQYHFSSKRGWINDPNGLVYYEGEYHLFYQHSPYDRNKGNKHWGHAVSTDLIHWEELPTALFPDEMGSMFSGSVVIDERNTAGFNRNGRTAMIAVYTASSREKQVQCMAYSLDKGRTWIKYADNPVIDSKSRWNSIHTRDPKVFWYEPTGMWVMALHEKDGISIYNSPDLRQWSYQSHVTGFWECPELFELPVEGQPNNKKWVLTGASGTYMLGKFDGKTFVPEYGKFYYSGGCAYAGQTFNNINRSDGRRIQICWGRILTNKMPFNGIMLLPTELKLRSTKNGVKLFSYPVKETEGLIKETFSANNLTAQQADEFMQRFNNEPLLKIKLIMKLSHATAVRLTLHNQNLFYYNMNTNQMNGVFYSPIDMTSMDVKIELFLDKNSVEGFVDDGAFSFATQWKPLNLTQGFKFYYDTDFEITSLEVSTLNSIWNNQMTKNKKNK